LQKSQCLLPFVDQAWIMPLRKRAFITFLLYFIAVFKPSFILEHKELERRASM
jgi:hypothetical protein